MLIAIHAAIGEGKDTVADLLTKHSPVHLDNKKFAEKLKQMVVLLTGCKREELEDQVFKDTIANGNFLHPITQLPMTYREIMQYMGTELFRDYFDPEVWVKSLFADFNPETSNWIVTDMRFPNELQKVQKEGGYTILVMRYKTRSEWREEFKDIFIPGAGPITNPSIKSSKQEFLDDLIERKVVDLNHPTFHKLNHVGERMLWQAYKKGEVKFDAVIKNDGTLTDLEQKIINFVDDVIVQ